MMVLNSQTLKGYKGWRGRHQQSPRIAACECARYGKPTAFKSMTGLHGVGGRPHLGPTSNVRNVCAAWSVQPAILWEAPHNATTAARTAPATAANNSSSSSNCLLLNSLTGYQQHIVPIGRSAWQRAAPPTHPTDQQRSPFASTLLVPALGAAAATAAPDRTAVVAKSHTRDTSPARGPALAKQTATSPDTATYRQQRLAAKKT